MMFLPYGAPPVDEFLHCISDVITNVYTPCFTICWVSYVDLKNNDQSCLINSRTQPKTSQFHRCMLKIFMWRAAVLHFLCHPAVEALLCHAYKQYVIVHVLITTYQPSISVPWCLISVCWARFPCWRSSRDMSCWHMIYFRSRSSFQNSSSSRSSRTSLTGLRKQTCTLLTTA